MLRFILILIGSFILVTMLTTTAFVVDQRKFGVVYSMGEVKQIIEEPGLNFKLPTPMQNVVLLDKRIMTTGPAEPDRLTTSDRSNVLVDFFINWRIVDPRQFVASFGGEEQRAQDRMNQLVKAALNEEIARRTVGELLAEDRAGMMAAVRDKVAEDARRFGVEVVDVRVKRVAYADPGSVIDHMKSEMMRIANERRSTGAAESEKNRADADRQSKVILAEAYRDAEKIRGDGDARASRIYAQAYGQNPEFYKFYRSLEAYKASFANRDVIVVDPSSEFFRYFKNPKGAGGK